MPDREHAPDSDEAGLARLAGEYGIELLDPVPEQALDPALVADIPVEWARAHCVLPVRLGDEVCVLLSDPAQLDEQEYLGLILGYRLRPVLSGSEHIADCIEKCYFRKKDSAADFLRDLDTSKAAAGPAVPKADDLLQSAQEAPITQLINLILLEAVKAGASDVHFEPHEARLRVRYRVDGMLYDQSAPPKHMEQALVSRLKVMTGMDISEKRLPQDGMARVRVGDREIDIRASALPVTGGERVVLRLLDKSSTLLPLAKLGMAEDTLARYGRLLRENTGILIVAGPTGSGKTTTLYASLQSLDTQRQNILTVEDPVEYQLADIGQMQVHPRIGLTFAAGLRHILRQDPDVILVGETRDLETAEIAIRASLTGHLVFTTLHTNDAPSSVVRMLDMGIEPYVLIASLKGVLAQRLVRKLCPACREEAGADPKELEMLGPEAKRLVGAPVWKAAGCENCLGGYRGRIGVFEFMVLDAEIRERLRAGRPDPAELRQAAVRRGMHTLVSDCIDKVQAGLTDISEALRVVGTENE